MTDVICDLDGVIYRGDAGIPGAGEALARLQASGARVFFVTNNSTSPPEAVALKIELMAGVPVDPEQVITSAMAAASMLEEADSPALIVGEEGLAAALDASGMAMTSDPSVARSVVAGMDRHLEYERIARAAEAVRSGARFIAANVDPTFPTATGLIPGAGAVVAAIAVASGREPEVAGKPNIAIRDLVKRSVGPNAWVVGDRIDTDVALAANEPGWRSVLVLTGVTAPTDDASAADHVVADFSAAVDLLLEASSGA